MNRTACAWLLLTLAASAGWAGDPAADSVAEIRESALAFLGSLSPELRKQASFPFDHAERQRWSNIPYTMHKRGGVSLDELAPHQRVLAHQLIQAPLSSQGYLKASGIMMLDDVLLDLAHAQGRDDPPFGYDYYWIAVFGDPAGSEPWGWQLDGHHLALNFTVVDGRLAVTPAFLGADPAEVRDGPYAGWRILGQEDDKGRAFFASLDDKQRARALLSAKGPGDIFAGTGQGERIQRIEGLPASALEAAQRTALLDLIDEYLGKLEPDLARLERDRLQQASLDAVHFAWMGTEPGKPYYYRIHGPTLLIEFDNAYPPGQDGGPINHIHTIHRDPANDYAEDWLRKHYQTSPHHQDD